MVSGEEDVTGYFYEGGNVSFEADQKGNITNHNVYGTNLLLRSDTETEKSHYYLYNAHGDVVRLTQTDTGDTAAEYRYDAFGNITYSTGDADNAITYAGYQYDAESGLYYVNARYYDSSTGRFITEDTYEGKYTDPLSLNRYTYCHNNPTRYTDPTGHAILPLIVGFGKFALGATFGAGMELFNQVFIEKRDKIGWGEVAFEGFAGGVGALAGAGSADDVIRATTKIGKAKAAVKTVTKAGCVDGAIGFTADVGKQALVEGKSLDEIDYGQAAKTGAISGVAGMGGAAFDMVADGTTALAKGVTRNADNAAESAGDAVRKGQHPKAKQNSPDADAPAHIKGMDEDVDTTGMGDRDVDTTGMGDQDVDTTGMGDAPAGTILSSPEPQKEIRETVEVAEEIHPDPAEEAAARAQAEAELNARRQAAMQSAQSKTIVGYGNDVAGEMSAGYRAEYQAFTSKGSGYTVPADMAGGACFVSGTQIKTDSGNKCIEEIHVGDSVYAKNTYTGEAGWKKVVRLFIKETTELIHIGLSGEVIDTTPTHPFWVDGYGFKAAEELKAGDYVETASGELLRIDHVEKEYQNTPVTVYNFEVEDWHTYYVSGEEILVHNMCMMTPGGGSSSGLKINQLPLAKPGEDLYVGTYNKSKYWNKKTGFNATHTPHHAVQDAISSVSTGKGITINIKQSIHPSTESYKSVRNGLIGNRQHLAADIAELRVLLRNEGYSRSVINAQLNELIKQNKSLGGFDK